MELNNKCNSDRLDVENELMRKNEYCMASAVLRAASVHNAVLRAASVHNAVLQTASVDNAGYMQPAFL